MNPKAIDEVIDGVVRNMLAGHMVSAKGKLSGMNTGIVSRQAKRVGVSHKVAIAVFMRDHFICRYCGKRTLFPPLLRLISDIYPKEFPCDPNWKMDKTHIVYWTYFASIDHVLPLARGGSNNVDNLVTTCYQCNSIKGNWLLEELRWDINPIIETTWDGLSENYISLARMLGKAKYPYHKNWIKKVQVYYDRPHPAGGR